MDLINTLLIYMSLMLPFSAGQKPALSPLPPQLISPPPIVEVSEAPSPVLSPSPSPQAGLASSLPIKPLAPGDKGNDVRALQQRLKDLGYFNATLDGVYGPKTRTAVKNFQKNNKLNNDGIAGVNTLKKLFSNNPVGVSPGGATAAPAKTAQIRVFYMADTGETLFRDVLTLPQGKTVISANDANVPKGYILMNERKQRVTVNALGVADPNTLIFSYRRSGQVQSVAVPVFYLDEFNKLLNTDTVQCAFGQTRVLEPVAGKVPQGYQLTSPAKLSVTVSARGIANPASVAFIYRKPASSAQATVIVSYVDENKTLLYTENALCLEGGNRITADLSKVPGYTLKSPGSVDVNVNAQGLANPATVRFEFVKNPLNPSPSTAPTSTPTSGGTALPTATAEPSAVPTETATVKPTSAPTATAEPTADPQPTPPPRPALPKIKDGVQATLSGDQPVYLGPGDGYYRVNTSATGECRVYAFRGDWALIAYSANNETHLGFIAKAALPEGTSAPKLEMTGVSATALEAADFKDSPDSGAMPLGQVSMGQELRFLAKFGDSGFALVEIPSFGEGKAAIGLVPERLY